MPKWLSFSLKQSSRFTFECLSGRSSLWLHCCIVEEDWGRTLSPPAIYWHLLAGVRMTPVTSSCEAAHVVHSGLIPGSQIQACQLTFVSHVHVLHRMKPPSGNLESLFQPTETGLLLSGSAFPFTKLTNTCGRTQSHTHTLVLLFPCLLTPSTAVLSPIPKINSHNIRRRGPVRCVKTPIELSRKTQHVIQTVKQHIHCSIWVKIDSYSETSAVQASVVRNVPLGTKRGVWQSSLWSVYSSRAVE